MHKLQRRDYLWRCKYPVI